LELFALARLITKVVSTNANGLPFEAEADLDNFKFLFVDTGLISQILQIPPVTIERFNTDLINSGALAEQFVGQELLTLLNNYSEPKLFYWQRERPTSQAEVDYLLAHQGVVLPIEVKAGSTGRLKSLRMFLDQKKSPFGIRISQHPLSYVDQILSVPLYAVSELPRLCGETSTHLRA
jgi:predicted AAA+ superfamily ATPase